MDSIDRANDRSVEIDRSLSIAPGGGERGGFGTIDTGADAGWSTKW
jgi:hypothetical protein